MNLTASSSIRRSDPKQTHAYAPRWRRWLLIPAAAAALLLPVLEAQAVGWLVDVNIVERDAGPAPSPVYSHRGRTYVAGRPGARYAIRLTNLSGERVLAVMSVDGVNIITGRSASFEQSGYVLGPWETHEITGWRKSTSEVAAFYFTALPDSYAARTGRPDDVGVIGVALFKERTPPALSQAAPPVGNAAGANGAAGAAGSREERRAAAPAAAQAEADGAPGSAADTATAGRAEARRDVPRPTERLGTGHGEREASYTRHTTFERSTRSPLEVVAIQYDSFENLARAGVIGAPPPIARPRPNPFPRAYGFVPDPAPRY
jgi:hypothetical protein